MDRKAEFISKESRQFDREVSRAMPVHAFVYQTAPQLAVNTYKRIEEPVEPKVCGIDVNI